jgi:hypothetical protein
VLKLEKGEHELSDLIDGRWHDLEVAMVNRAERLGGGCDSGRPGLGVGCGE